VSKIDRPVIVLGAPRSGTTILRHCLALHPDLWHLPGESHEVLEGPFHPGAKGYESNRVTAEDLDDALAGQLRSAFTARSINFNVVSKDPTRTLRANSISARVAAKITTRIDGARSMKQRPAEIRFLEKTPKNMLRVPMLAKLFPDAHFIHLARNAPSNIRSLIGGWRAVDHFGPITRERFARSGYPIAAQLGLADYAGESWKFTLVPGWRKLQGQRLADVAAWQYFQCNRIALGDLNAIDPARVRRITHEAFVQEPVTVLRELFAWADLAPSPVAEKFAGELPRVNAVPGSATPVASQPAGYVDEATAAINAIVGMDQLLADLGYA